MNIYIIIAPAMAVVIWFLAYVNYHIDREHGVLITRVDPSFISSRLNIVAAVVFGLLLLSESGLGIAQVLIDGNGGRSFGVVLGVSLAVVLIAVAYAWAVKYVAKRILSARRRVVAEEIEAVRDRVRREFDAEYGDEIYRLKKKVVNFHSDAGLDRFGQEVDVPNAFTIAMMEAHEKFCH